MLKKSINIINRITVHKTHLSFYEKWLKCFQKTLISFKGFNELKVIKTKLSNNKEKTEFNLHISFDSYANLKRWEKSRFQKKYSHKALEFSKCKIRHPIFWKGFLITILTVFPLILVTDLLLCFILPMHTLEPKIAIFLNLILVAMLMQYPIMPLTNKYFGNWLTKK